MLDHVVDALADYVDEFDGREPLRQKHYLEVCSTFGWPPPSSITDCARKHGIGAKAGESPFQAMVDLGRKRARERGRAEAA